MAVTTILSGAMDLTPYSIHRVDKEALTSNFLLGILEERRYVKEEGERNVGWTSINEDGTCGSKKSDLFRINKTSEYGDEIPTVYTIEQDDEKEIKKLMNTKKLSHDEISTEFWETITLTKGLEFLFYPERNLFFVSTTAENRLSFYEKMALESCSHAFHYNRCPDNYKVGSDLLRWIYHRFLLENGIINDSITVKEITDIHSECAEIQDFRFKEKGVAWKEESLETIFKERNLLFLCLDISKRLPNNQIRRYLLYLFYDGRVAISPIHLSGYTSIEGERRYKVVRDVYGMVEEINNEYLRDLPNWENKNVNQFIPWLAQRLGKK